MHERVIVIDTSDTHDQLHVLINPEIIASSGQSDYEEGCLSVPGVFGKVPVPSAYHSTPWTGTVTFPLDAEGLLAVCIQHEMDHLLGKVFVEYWSWLKQSRIQTRLKKQRQKVM